MPDHLRKHELYLIRRAKARAGDQSLSGQAVGWLRVQPEVQYARIESAAVAYHVVGEGPLDLVFLPEWVNNLEMQWQDPRLARFPTRLASFSRVVMLNMRGIGLSDPLPHDDSPTIEHWMDDITAVLDVLGSTRAALLGTGIGGSLALVFAATYPERVAALVLVNATARSSAAPDYPFGIDAAWREHTRSRWPGHGGGPRSWSCWPRRWPETLGSASGTAVSNGTGRAREWRWRCCG